MLAISPSQYGYGRALSLITAVFGEGQGDYAMLWDGVNEMKYGWERNFGGGGIVESGMDDLPGELKRSVR
uniref:Uncharacterized protein n=1 Tax=Pristionchus pacificus TaxID=54126 RepID=A0A2A6BD63_PRIPA|eukprot:PDM63840.1 hypothetical protein PRIPAC_49813 [Pristionchus pacificus]